MLSSELASQPELTNEQKLITKLVESAKQDLAKINTDQTKLQETKKARIQRLASDLDNYGVIPTHMICNFITSKLAKCPGIGREVIIRCLDAKYKNANRVASHSRSPSPSPSQLPSVSASPYTANAADWPSDFNIRDCQIESWDMYPDCIKKRWVECLIQDKRSLMQQIIELQQTQPKI
jgi:hypothetical protein